MNCNTERLCVIRIQLDDDCSLLKLHMPRDTKLCDVNYNAYIIEVMEEVGRVIRKEQASHVMFE